MRRNNPNRHKKFKLIGEKEAIDALYQAIQTRPRPEDVAELILNIMHKQLNSKQIRDLETAAQNSLARNYAYYSSMAADFFRPEGAKKQVRTAEDIFSLGRRLFAEDCLDPILVQKFTETLSSEIHYKLGENNFKENRFNRSERETIGLVLTKRQYNKRWRLLKRLENKIQRLLKSHKKYNFTRIGHTALATRISYKDLEKDIPTSCFIAYYSARLNLRSVFTNTSQTPAYDQISDMLYQHACRSPDVNWLAIAYIHPIPDVLEHISENQKGALLGLWFHILQDIAEMLKDIWEKTDINLETMIVKNGNDSSSWNQTARAWNKARDHWISLLSALGLQHILDDICPGKVLRLMAADVAAWHSMSKGDLHPDTKIWAELPYPWDVLHHKALCTKAMVENVCKKHHVAPQKWTGPLLAQKAVPFTATPELVHGVAISSPDLAAHLKQAKWFSGKPSQALENVRIDRDDHGFALHAKKKQLDS